MTSFSIVVIRASLEFHFIVFHSSFGADLELNWPRVATNATDGWRRPLGDLGSYCNCGVFRKEKGVVMELFGDVILNGRSERKEGCCLAGWGQIVV